MRPKLAILARQFSGRDSKTQDDSDKEEGRQEVKDTKIKMERQSWTF